MPKRNRKPQLLSTNQILNNSGLNMRMISPKTDKQNDTFIAYELGKHLLLHGSAGTGKTFMSLYLALQEVMDYRRNFFKVMLVRSVVPTREMGFLPGSEKQKIAIYEQPYVSIVNDLYGRGDAYEILRKKELIEFKSTSYVRGMTYDNCIVIVDECQNLNFHELDSIITRMGLNSKILFCGDFTQTDFRTNEKMGLITFMEILKNLEDFAFVEFGVEDIVRSGIVKDYIIQKQKHFNAA